LQLIYQNNIIKEYESWTHLLLNIINTTKSNTNNSTHIDYATPIQKHLEKISKLELDNYELQKKFVKQMQSNKILKHKSDHLEMQLDMIKQDVNNCNKDELKNEIASLVNNIDMITEELDHLSLCNKNYQGNLDSDSKTIIALLNTIDELEKENNDLKAVKKLTYFDFVNNKNELSAEYLLTNHKEDESSILITKNNFNKKGVRNKNSNKSFYYDFTSLSCFSNTNTIYENDSTINYYK
jgi:hypothetical protein